MRAYALRYLAAAFVAALATATIAQTPSGNSAPAAVTVASTAVGEVNGRVPDIFDDVSQLVRVDAKPTLEIVKNFQRDNPSRREFVLNLASQGYEEDDSNPALRVTSISVGPAGMLMEITGLARTRNSVSAVMRRDTLRLKNSKGETSALIAAEGVTELQDRRGGSALIVNPGDKLFLVFSKFDDYFGYSLSHVNRDGRESVYFARIDPRFDERYEAMYAAATTPNGMKEFVVEFARNDPKGRVLAVFSKLLVQMRAQNSFEGYYTAFQLLGEPRDYAGMERTAVSAEQKSVIQSIEAEKQAQVRRQQAAEQEEARRRDAQLMAQQQAEQARLAEQRCLATPDCLREMESRRAACVQSIQNCRGQCDRLSGAGSFNSFISNLAAAGISAACSRACKCESSFGDLLARFNNASSGNSSGSTRANVATSNPAPASARAPALTVDAAPSRRSIEAPAAKPTQRELSDHVCALNCKGPDGKASITVQAGDAAEAARLVDPQGHQICKRAGYEAATPIRMSASQCRKK